MPNPDKDLVLSSFPAAPGQMAAVGPEHGEKPSINTYGDYGPRNLFTPRQELDNSAARFFYCAKTSRADRNEGCEKLEDKPLHWSNGTYNPGSFQSDGTKKSSPNNHPTVKPTALMRYLIKLVTQKGGHVLDPFNGSGSTGKAAMLEHMLYTGIDMDQHNISISEARIKYAINNRDNQMDLF